MEAIQRMQTNLTDIISDISKLTFHDGLFEIVTLDGLKVLVCGKKHINLLEDMIDKESITIVFCGFSLSSTSENLQNKLKGKFVFHFPTTSLDTPSNEDMRSACSLLQIRGRGEKQSTVEITQHKLENIEVFQPGSGRLVVKNRDDSVSNIIATEQLLNDKDVLQMMAKSEIVVCRASKDIQFNIFWEAIKVNTIPVMPNGPTINSPFQQAIYEKLLNDLPNRVVNEAANAKEVAFEEYCKYYLAAITQLKYYYADGLTQEFLQLAFDSENFKDEKAQLSE